MDDNNRSGYRNGKLIYPISILDHKDSGGGGSMKPGPNTVGSDEIIDKSIKLEDLNDEVINRMDETYVENEESLYLDGEKPQQNKENNEPGFEAAADDGEGDI